MNETNDVLRPLAERRVDAKRAFQMHGVAYVIANGCLTALNLMTMPNNPWVLWSIGFWGVALAVEGFSVYGVSSRARERAITAELERLRH